MCLFHLRSRLIRLVAGKDISIVMNVDIEPQGVTGTSRYLLAVNVVATRAGLRHMPLGGGQTSMGWPEEVK